MPAERGVEHVGDPQARLGVEGQPPELLVDAADVVLRDVPVAGELVGEGAHVARALHVVLPAERVDADALAADVAGDHGQVGHAHHHRRALGVLGDAEAVVDRGVAGGAEEPGRGAQLVGVDAGRLGHRLGGVGRVGDEGEVLVGVLAALAHELLVVQPLGDDHVGHRVDEGDVGAGQHRQVVRRLDVRAADQVDPARVGDDQLGALAQPPLHPRGEDGVGVGRVGADQQHHVGLVDRAEVLGAGGGAEGLLEAVAGGGVAHPRAGVDVVVAERRPHHLLDDVHLLVGAAARGDAADRADAVLGLDGLEARRRPWRSPPPTRPRATRRRSCRAPSGTSWRSRWVA